MVEHVADAPGTLGVSMSGLRRLKAAIAFILLPAFGVAERAVAQETPSDKPTIAVKPIHFQVFRECDTCPQMMVLPPGSFVMGSAPGEDEDEGVEAEYRGWSRPQARIIVGTAFALGTHEVTVREFDAFVRSTGHRTGDDCFSYDHRDDTYRRRAGVTWQRPGFPQTEDHPIVCVTWEDAKAYAAWLARKTGKDYRLPTDAEWEYAARAGTTSRRFWGDDSGRACAFANVLDQSANRAWRESFNVHACDDRHVHTAPVGTALPNAFGLYDMIGNAWEWVEDCWVAGHARRPGTAIARLSGDCLSRTMRGGSWYSNPWLARSADRANDGASVGIDTTGFRIARGM